MTVQEIIHRYLLQATVVDKAHSGLRDELATRRGKRVDVFSQKELQPGTILLPR